MYRSNSDSGLASGADTTPGIQRAGVAGGLAIPERRALRAEDLVNAWAYARSHGAEISRQIAEIKRDGDYINVVFP